ncbi:MAG: HsmA family protein [Spirochaetales bacterium]
MSTTLLVAITFIFSALILYTVGVWAEKLGGRLKWWHVVVFYFGVTCDTIGTGAMGLLAGSLIQFNLHGLTGMLAILLMLFHAVWATVVLIRKDEALIKSFHKFSLVVWSIWLVPMISGMVLGSSV